MKCGRTAAIVAAMLFVAGSGISARAQVQNLKMEGASVSFKMGENGSMKVTAVADNIVHVQFAKDPAFFTHESFCGCPRRLPGSGEKRVFGISNGGFRSIRR